MSDESAPPDPVIAAPVASETTTFAAPSEYAAALDRVLPLAEREILVFDQDLFYGDWGTAARYDVLRAFLLSHRLSRLQIVVHNTLHIERLLPRLTRLLREMSHKFEILRTTGHARTAWDGFTLVDGRHLVHRFHLDTMKGELSLDNPLKAGELRSRYDEILASTEAGINATQLGL